jgi:hypothetical protein
VEHRLSVEEGEETCLAVRSAERQVVEYQLRRAAVQTGWAMVAERRLLAYLCAKEASQSLLVRRSMPPCFSPEMEEEPTGSGCTGVAVEQSLGLVAYCNQVQLKEAVLWFEQARKDWERHQSLDRL